MVYPLSVRINCSPEVSCKDSLFTLSPLLQRGSITFIIISSAYNLETRSVNTTFIIGKQPVQNIRNFNLKWLVDRL